VPPAPKPKQKKIEGITFWQFEKLLKHYFRITEP